MKEIPPTGITMALLLGGSGGRLEDLSYPWIENTDAYNLLFITYFITEN